MSKINLFSQIISKLDRPSFNKLVLDRILKGIQGVVQCVIVVLPKRTYYMFSTDRWFGLFLIPHLDPSTFETS